MRFIYALLVLNFLNCSKAQNIQERFIASINSKDTSAFLDLVTTNYVSISETDTLGIDETIQQIISFEANDVKFRLDSSKIVNSEIILFLTESNYLSRNCSKLNELRTSIKLYIEKDRIYRTEWSNLNWKTMTANTDLLLNYYYWYKNNYPSEWEKIEELFIEGTHESSLKSDKLLQTRITEYCTLNN